MSQPDGGAQGPARLARRRRSSTASPGSSPACATPVIVVAAAGAGAAAAARASRCATDAAPGRGPLEGIAAGMRALGGRARRRVPGRHRPAAPASRRSSPSCSPRCPDTTPPCRSPAGTTRRSPPPTTRDCSCAARRAARRPAGRGSRPCSTAPACTAWTPADLDEPRLGPQREHPQPSTASCAALPQPAVTVVGGRAAAVQVRGGDGRRGDRRRLAVGSARRASIATVNGAGLGRRPGDCRSSAATSSSCGSRAT